MSSISYIKDNPLASLQNVYDTDLPDLTKINPTSLEKICNIASKFFRLMTAPIAIAAIGYAILNITIPPIAIATTLSIISFIAIRSLINEQAKTVYECVLIGNADADADANAKTKKNYSILLKASELNLYVDSAFETDANRIAGEQGCFLNGKMIMPPIPDSKETIHNSKEKQEKEQKQDLEAEKELTNSVIETLKTELNKFYSQKEANEYLLILTATLSQKSIGSLSNPAIHHAIKNKNLFDPYLKDQSTAVIKQSGGGRLKSINIIITADTIKVTYQLASGFKFFDTNNMIEGEPDSNNKCKDTAQTALSLGLEASFDILNNTVRYTVTDPAKGKMLVKV